MLFSAHSQPRFGYMRVFSRKSAALGWSFVLFLVVGLAFPAAGLKCHECNAAANNPAMLCVDLDGNQVLGVDMDCESEKEWGCFSQTFQDNSSILARTCIPAVNQFGFQFKEGCHEGDPFNTVNKTARYLGILGWEKVGQNAGIYCACRTDFCNKEPSMSGQDEDVNQN